jgi:hypothetical protein
VQPALVTVIMFKPPNRMLPDSSLDEGIVSHANR